MEYYKSNAVYDFIIAKNLNQFKFVVGNAWQLVYGDNNCNPLVLVLAVGVHKDEIGNQPSEQDKNAFTLLKWLADKTNLPIIYIRFIDNLDSIESVVVSSNLSDFSTISLAELSVKFGTIGLPVSNTQTNKYLNDKTSSAYHNWQRNSLGAALTVSDIDLWLINNTGEPEVVFELKRSYYDLSRWKPFTDDYRNFKLISNLCNKANIGMKILYNQRLKNPFQDKIDQLKIFSVDFSKNPPISEDGIIDLEKFKNLGQ